MPFTELANWENWLNDYERWLIERDKDRYFEDFFPHAKPVWNTVMGRLRDFTVPIIEIPKVPSRDSERIAEVCAIFEKMNSTGVPLSVYDLLTARLYRYGIDLHRLWEEAIGEHERLNEISGGEPDAYGLYTLRALALIRGQEVKSKTLINLAPENFVEDWQRTTTFMEKALQRIQSTNPDGFGAFASRWLPYSTMVPVLAALLHYIESNHLDHRALQGVKRWYWGSVFLERYAGAVESISAADYRSLVGWFEQPEQEPEVFKQIEREILNNPNFRIRPAARMNSVYKGIMNLIAIRGAKDFRADDFIKFHVLDDHHIFPQAYLKKLEDESGQPRYKPVEINTIVNKTLISSRKNRRISRQSPSQYLDRLVLKERCKEILATHFIEGDALRAMETNNYDAFLEAREQALLNEIRLVVAGDWD